MPRVARSESQSGIYHITARGVGRKRIFEDDVDRRDLFVILKRLLDEMAVDILGWVFMSNHVHVIMRGSLEDISKLMQRAATSYSMHFNGRHGHVGHVFQGRFHSEPIESDEHFMMALCYTHQNPIRANMVGDYNYRWSSYREYVGKTSVKLCDVEFGLSLFGGEEGFIRFHEVNLGMVELNLSNYHCHITDAEALKIMEDLYGSSFPDEVALMPKPKRNACLRVLKANNLSVRQIERLTGIGRSIVARA